MVFSSIIFIFAFLPITLLGYYILYICNKKLTSYWLLFVSLIFFAWNQQYYLWIILLNIFINFIFGLILSKYKYKILVAISIVLNLLILIYFKYFNFIVDNISLFLENPLDVENVILPIGISFFTFQGMSYVIDVYRGDATVQKNIFKLALYITLFPQLIAGPIVRYKDIMYDINNIKVTLDDFCDGIRRFSYGLAKKAIVANTLAFIVDEVWRTDIHGHGVITLWVASISYTLQIFYDFSGYSDMAIGIGEMLGFYFKENFNFPYISKSITEFWRRWHISLSSWFKDYVYIPLGGNRKRGYLNLIIVFLLTGIWHGAAYNFIIWGIFNLIFVLIEKIFSLDIKINKNQDKLWVRITSTFYALFIINLSWVLFRSPDIASAIDYISLLFGIIDPDRVLYTVLWYFDRWSIFIFIIGIIFASKIPREASIYIRDNLDFKIYIFFRNIFVILLLLFSIFMIATGTYNPFIYFQF